MPKYLQRFLDLCRSVTARRPRVVIDHILEHGYVTTEELKEIYGYNHPPRAARDVKELGIPLKTFRVNGSDGRQIAAYKFDDLSKIPVKLSAGRSVLSKEIKLKLIEKHGSKCFIYLEEMEGGHLQVDHRIPYEVTGNDDIDLHRDNFMLLCASANRAKSWSCENCDNWKKNKDPKICKTCYWAFPEEYSHISMRQIRRLDLIWEGDSVAQYEEIKSAAASNGVTMPDFVKDAIRKQLKKDSNSEE